MTRKERLREQYEDALFALIMEEAAEAEGQKALEENRRLRDSGLAIPDGLRQRCHRAIAKGFAGQELRRVGRGVSRVVTKVALVALVGMLLLTTVFAASEDFRVKTLNLALEIFEDHTEITLTPDESIIASSVDSVVPQLTAGWVPDGFALVEEGENSAMAWKDFQNEEAGTQISITVFNLRTGRMSVDTEDAEMLPIQINGADAFIINDTEDEIIQIIWQEDAASEWLIYVVGMGVSEEMTNYKKSRGN